MGVVDLIVKIKRGTMSASEENGGQETMFTEILNHLRTSVSTKNALIKKEKVEYVTGAKLVECLVSSKWAESDTATPYNFKSRDNAVKFCQKILDKQHIVGGQKIEVQKAKKDDGEDEEDDESKKKVRRFRVDFLKVKRFVDSSEDIYIWNYDPPNKYKYIIGTVLMLGIVAFTLQPLWPESSKYGMWYVSVLLMVLLGVLLLVYVVRWFLWGLVFTVSVGKVNLWLLPNLDNEKLGVLDSFKPLYSIKYKKKKKKVKKESEQEEEEPLQSSLEDKGNEKTKED